MSRMNKTYVNQEDLVKIARSAGCRTLEQSAFIKIERDGTTNKLYVARTKECARVDLSGFEVPAPDEVRNLGGESFGAVHQQLRFDRPAEDILKSFQKLCTELVTYPSIPGKSKGRPAGLKGSKKEKVETEEEKAATQQAAGAKVEVKMNVDAATEIDRLVRKKKMMTEYAAKNNAKINQKTLDGIEAKIAELTKLLPVEPATSEAPAAE